MITDYIRCIVNSLMIKYKETDPFRLAETMGIVVEYQQGLFVKGYLFYNARKLHIVIDSDLPRWIQLIVCIHEIGHAVLHLDKIKKGHVQVCKFCFDETRGFEYEANLFAADYIVPNDAASEMRRRGLTCCEYANELFIPEELFCFKLIMIKSQGEDIELPYTVSSDFLKKPIVPGLYDDYHFE